MHKLSYLVGQDWLEHSYAPVFAYAAADTGEPRIESTAPGGDITPFEQLTNSTEPPYRLLYILHVNRGEGKPGRYVSPVLTQKAFSDFLVRFRAYFQGDGRFDLWSHSDADGSTVVWDRHNKIFAYGDLDVFTSRLRSLGFHEDKFAIPSPHIHHFHREFDGDATDVLTALPWQYYPLEAEDEY
jgi:hypothetical protein